MLPPPLLLLLLLLLLSLLRSLLLYRLHLISHFLPLGFPCSYQRLEDLATQRYAQRRLELQTHL